MSPTSGRSFPCGSPPDRIPATRLAAPAPPRSRRHPLGVWSPVKAARHLEDGCGPPRATTQNRETGEICSAMSVEGRNRRELRGERVATPSLGPRCRSSGEAFWRGSTNAGSRKPTGTEWSSELGCPEVFMEMEIRPGYSPKPTQDPGCRVPYPDPRLWSAGIEPPGGGRPHASPILRFHRSLEAALERLLWGGRTYYSVADRDYNRPSCLRAL